ncbi:MAG: hypothetical protein IKM63_04760 [Firmicutes bacterium]|nr:hypothetical protein [Bacillota bacterium]
MIRKRMVEKPLEKMPLYYKRIKEYFDIIMIHSSLAGKADLGSGRSEKGYQLIAASTSGQMARALGCSEDKAEALSLAVGQFFPKYGMAGVEPIKEYIVNNKIDLDPDTLGVDLVEYIINRRLLVATDFDEKLHQYYRGDDSDPEVRIVRFVQQTIKEVKIAEKYFAGNPGDLLFDVSQEIVKLAGETGQLTSSRILDEYRQQIDTYQSPVLTEEQRQDIIAELDGYIHSFCEKTGDMEKLNETREAAILIYMESAV